MKRDRAKNRDIFKDKIKQKSLLLKFNNQTFTIVKTNHLYDERTTNKQRDHFISDDIYKQIIRLALINGLTSFREKGTVAITLANSKRKMHSCSCLLIALNKDNIITVISVVQTYGDKKWQRGFVKVHNRINILPGTYIIPKMSEEELKDKMKEKIFNHSTKEAYEEDKLFKKYANKKNITKGK